MAAEGEHKDIETPGAMHVLGVCSQSEVKTRAIGQFCTGHGVSQDNVFYIKRSTPPQPPASNDPEYETKRGEYTAALATWKRGLAEEQAQEHEKLAQAENARKNGDVAVIYCLNTNAITVDAQGLDQQPTAVKTDRLSHMQISKFMPDAQEFEQLVIGMQYAGARTAAFQKIVRQLDTHGVPLEEHAGTIYAIESIGEVDRIGKEPSLLDATTALRDIACIAVHDADTGATVRGSSDALVLPEEAKRLVYDGKGEVTIGQAMTKLFCRQDDKLIPLVAPEHHQDPHRDMSTEGNDRKSVIARTINEVIGEGDMNAVRAAINAKNGEIEVSSNNLPLNDEYQQRLEGYRELVREFQGRLAQEYSQQQEGPAGGFASRFTGREQPGRTSPGGR
ncbi:MAG TPA: hypothetical protein VFT64_00625 [Rickettsiales bacterium]|nr:hypothetical protein [Rickettsiales bacterium]